MDMNGIAESAREELPDSLLPLLDPQSRFLLWSGRHGAWWRPDALGYTTDRDEAGRFACFEAVGYVLRSSYYGDPEEVVRLVWTPS